MVMVVVVGSSGGGGGSRNVFLCCLTPQQNAKCLSGTDDIKQFYLLHTEKTQSR